MRSKWVKAKRNCNVCSAVAVRGLELKPEVLVIEALEPLVGDRGARQVVAKPLEAATVASANRYVGVEIEAVGTRAASS